MKQITKEQIDKIVNDVSISIINDISLQYSENLATYVNTLQDADDVIKQALPYFAAVKTAQDNCISILKESLKELLCD